LDILVIALVSFIASGLTLFSGFGLGTLLTPVFALFFPIDIAIALTAVVHLANNLFKFFLLGKFADKEVVIRFGVPAILAALLGAWLLNQITALPPLLEYSAFGKAVQITPVKFSVALIMVAFALIEFSSLGEKLTFEKKYLPVGGVLSGFFGGLSGNQGALRSAFLIRCNLDKEAFIGTGVVIACLIDVSRLAVYRERFTTALLSDNLWTLVIASVAAFLGVFVGARLVEKITMRVVQLSVAVGLIFIAALLGSGII
jgi:uncharacterized protein